MNRSIYFSLLTLLFFSACQPATTTNESSTTQEATPAPLSFADQLEEAHAKTAFHAKAAIQFDLELTFGGKKRFEGTVTLATDSGAGLLEDVSGRQLYYVKDSIYYASNDERSPKSLRFSAYTWPYFFLLPYKLNDPGTQWEDYANKSLNGENYLVEKLSFAAGTGDAPDDWYIVYANAENKLTEVAAYIVTAGKSQAEAEEDPHAIKYENYQNIDGIPIAHNWTFWGWRTEEGLTDQLGSAVLSNVQFITVTPETFTPPATFIAG